MKAKGLRESSPFSTASGLAHTVNVRLQSSIPMVSL